VEVDPYSLKSDAFRRFTRQQTGALLGTE